MFSPYYAWARRRGRGDPLDHVGLNVALYGPRGKRWAFTERGRDALSRSASRLAIGPSELVRDGDGLTVRIHEVTVPFPSRIHGTVRVLPAAEETRVWALDGPQRHRWMPIAPRARVEVVLERPALHWSGTAYCDANAGDRPLEDDFIRWDWSRAHRAGATDLLYDARLRTGVRTCLALRHGNAGIEERDPPPVAPLPRTLWRLERTTRAGPRDDARVLRTLEDTPFYARSLLRLGGAETPAMHESLALDRFRAPLVQLMLPFRMPRAAHWRP